MQTFKINNATISFNFVADTKLIGTFTIMFNQEQFLEFLDKHNILEVIDGNIIYDEYVEDDEGITHMKSHGIGVYDYITNYITQDCIEQITEQALTTFVNNLKP
jgi:hypothetical protein